MQRCLKNKLVIFSMAFSFLLVSWAPLVDHHRWPIKTHPHKTTGAHNVEVTDLIQMPDPPGVHMNDARFEEAIIPSFDNTKNLKEGDLVKVKGYLQLVAYEDNDDEYHIQISESKESGNDCLIVEVPDPKNVTEQDLKDKYEAVRSFIRDNILHGKEPSKGGNLIGGRAHLYVTGQLFYDDSHTHNQVRGKKGLRSNTLWEIHPIIDMGFAP